MCYKCPAGRMALEEYLETFLVRQFQSVRLSLAWSSGHKIIFSLEGAQKGREKIESRNSVERCGNLDWPS